MKTIFQAMRKRWDAYFERLTKANEKSFGAGSLDCCDLNSDHKKSQTSSGSSSKTTSN
ncbi:MAG: hypothetical protein HQ557_08435 [Bacteroidetes bacterium]|nr:hypothetical protein [Bacteroidota bacterium]